MVGAETKSFSTGPFRATTIVAVQGDRGAAIAGDGQVTFGERTVMKRTARKVRRLAGGSVLAGFAGAAADAFTLFERFENELEKARGGLLKAAVSLASAWRTDRALRHLEALLIVLDASQLLVVSGTGEVIEPDDGVAAVGSGAPYALAAARALLRHTDMQAGEICREALILASEICVFTNDAITLEEL